MLSAESLERALRTIQAASLFNSRVETIVEACASAGLDDVVVAVVEHNLIFGGAWPVPLRALQQRVGPLEATGWVLIFPARAHAAEVELRCLAFGRLASRKAAGLQSWARKHPGVFETP